MPVEFRVASSDADYALADRLTAKVGEKRVMLSFPTVMAFDEDELIGFIGTRIEKKLVVAGPLIMIPEQRRIFTALRLCEVYESVLRNIGLTSVIFHVETGSLLDKAIKRYYPSMEPYARQGDQSFFVWRLDGRRSISSGTEPGGAPASTGASGLAITPDSDAGAAEAAK